METSLKWTPKVGPALALSFELSLCKTDITLRQTDSADPKGVPIERVGCKLRALPAEEFGHVQSLTVICGFNVKKIESVMWRPIKT